MGRAELTPVNISWWPAVMLCTTKYALPVHWDIEGGKHITEGCACGYISSETGDGEHLHLCGSTNTNTPGASIRVCSCRLPAIKHTQGIVSQQWPDFSTRAGIQRDISLVKLFPSQQTGRRVLLCIGMAASAAYTISGQCDEQTRQNKTRRSIFALTSWCATTQRVHRLSMQKVP